MRIPFVIAMSLWAVLGQAGAQQEPLSPQAIVERSLQVARENYQAAPHYDFYRTVRGKDGQTKTYHDVMLAGSRYSRLVKINGEPLSAAAAAEEQRKWDVVKRLRFGENLAEHQKRVRGYERDRERDQIMMMEMGRAFQFLSAGQGIRDGHHVYILKATPRKSYRPPNNRAKVLTGMEGKLWIDTKTFQWVRVDATVIHPVSIEGFLARVQPGTRFEMDLMPVTEKIWMPRHFAMRSHARILFFFNRREEEEETYEGYEPNTEVWPQVVTGGGN